MFKLTALNNRRLPTIEDAVKYLKAADEEDPASRDVRGLMAIIAKMQEEIPRLRGIIGTRRAAIASFDWIITPNEPSDAERANQARLRCRRAINSIMFQHTDMPLNGALVDELTWDTQGLYGTTPKILKRFHPTEIERWGSDPSKLMLLADTANLTRIPIAAQNPQEYLVACDDSWLQGGILRSLIPHEIILLGTIQEWNAFNAKLKGIIQAKIEEWASDDDKTTAAAALRQVAQHNYALTSKAVEYAYTKITDAAGSTSFKDLKAELEADRSITILGQANTTQLPNNGGSRAAVEILKLISADIHYTDMQKVEQLINEQLLTYDFQLNGNPAATEAPWEFKIDLSQERDTEKEARTATELLTNGVPLLKSEVYAKTGYTVPGDGDEVIEPKAAPAPFGA